MSEIVESVESVTSSILNVVQPSSIHTNALKYLNILNGYTPNFINFEIPNVETPFGLKLWPIFNEFATLITGGKFIPNEFQYIEGETFLSTNKEVFIGIITYYFIITIGQLIFKKLQPLKLQLLFSIHNFFLTSASLTLLVLLFEQILPILVNHGLLYAICSPNTWSQKLVTIYYLNYLTKFVEFVDTYFLVVKKKKIIFLHSYHHGATALLCFIQLGGATSVSWIPILLNLGVHVVMYWYYFLASRGIRVWWKKWITTFQILQFVLDLCAVYFSTYTFYANKYSTELGINIPNMGTCYGTPFAAGTGCAILSSYLVLFIGFYIKTYKIDKPKTKTN
ncbi:Elongation of fatty acids protein [Wickerhamomyces ciferrii]|uniref:Elongation of fatty acids protein n=1 Tax=Wickerhamomyces ciferrii (strain ATCC 14091 / BCRC 22168 / CBS 111 / JCM 3599 / NBRC 0793 / NRRL Y-1031 F-60-10) TaxID=1206466 RepID=K0L0P3_WICCF|nr:Elongation of fatty acids protein [Wickerhamomyces ciferrii]CCH47018.1 Elongation of fatty acids protein [Wickerhamomyces ciferrii]